MGNIVNKIGSESSINRKNMSRNNKKKKTFEISGWQHK